MSAELIVRPVTFETWRDFERLFESRGAPKSCWCTVWRTVQNRPESDLPAVSKKLEMERRVSVGEPVGLLGYCGAEPVAWCSIAPRNTYRAGMSDVMPGDDQHTIWSIACFFISRQFRGQGIFRQLMAAAETHAISHGATLLEGYPVDPDSPSYRFGGFLPAFEQAGYSAIGRKGARRHIVRKLLTRQHSPGPV